ncbi:hypothetical protein F5Y17DRAFT_305974 [Xylariaceae sp. FL0594]|nr:hypothetical protein F5Y17DRAFT_305974 [Xylariaceae sp. FL0594]
MAAGNENRLAYEQYPFLTHEEFAEACHYLDAKYVQATLGDLRKDWRLTVHTALDTSAGHLTSVTFVQIARPLDNTQVDDQLATQLGNVALRDPKPVRRSRRIQRNQESDADRMMIEAEEADKEVLIQQNSRPSRARFQSGHVIYEIHLHPTYRVPCLWFSLHNLPIDESPLDFDTVLRHLVPDQFKQILRSQPAIGGISIEHHPITGVPAFFVHPCLLADAMADLDCSKENYLMAWLGLVGGCVGLWVPKEMAPGQA